MSHLRSSNEFCFSKSKPVRLVCISVAYTAITVPILWRLFPLSRYIIQCKIQFRELYQIYCYYHCRMSFVTTTAFYSSHYLGFIGGKLRLRHEIVGLILLQTLLIRFCK